MDLYAQSVLDFVRVSTEFCRQVEQTDGTSREDFVDVMLRLLPMLYLRASLLDSDIEAEGFAEHRVTEEDYDYVRSRLSVLMGDADTFLEVHTEDFRFSDTPVTQTVSENLADIYQCLRDMVETFREGFDDAMAAALSEAQEAFREYWGQELLNALRALHDVKYGS